MHGDGGVAEHGLARVVATTTEWRRRRSGWRPARPRPRCARPHVRQRGQAARAPVDDPARPVDEPVVEQPLEDRLHRAGQAASMVNRSRDQSTLSPAGDLAEDRAARVAFHCHTRSTKASRPRSCRLRPSLASSRSTTFWVAMPRVVHARQPQRVVTLHPPPPDQRVDQRVVEGMADVQRAGHVRRRDDDARTQAGPTGASAVQ